MNQIIILLSSADASYFNGWDKVGAVAVCVLMLGVLVALHRSGLKRVDTISDRLITFVETQTRVLSDLTSAHRAQMKSAEALHSRIDNILVCHKAGCPIGTMLRTEGN